MTSNLTSPQGRPGKPSAATLVALTPAHNEVGHLAGLAESLAGQMIGPLTWIVVDDGSSDGTGDVADSMADKFDFVDVIHRPQREGRLLSSKAEAIDIAYARAQELHPDFDYVASIDADVELPPDTFARIIDEFSQHPKLGVTGGVYSHPVGDKMVVGWTSATHVPGPLQVFRREVFEAVGGYQRLQDGGLDVVSTAKARMLGWETRVTPDLHFVHNREMGTGGDRHRISAQFHQGIRDRSLGVSPIFELAKSARRLFTPTPIVSSTVRMAGYLYAAVTRRRSLVEPEVAAFIRHEQDQRLTRWIPGSKRGATG